MSELKIQKATRQGVKPLIGVYSESGCGKTMSALLMARGFVGANGKIVMIDTESGRGQLYADVIPGGYEVLPMTSPFTPDRHIEAVETVEKSGAAIGIIDSASHEWEGLGGVCDWAGRLEASSGKPGLHNWREPKMAHARFMLKLLQSPIPWIICLRAKFKTRQGKNAQGKTEIVKDDRTSPIQAEDFIFEMTAHGEIFPDHTFHMTKCSHPELGRCMPNNELTTVRHGELIAQWCAAPAGPGTSNPLKDLKKKLWELTKEQHQGDPGKLNQFLWDENYQVDTESVGELSAERLAEIIKNLQAKKDEVPI